MDVDLPIKDVVGLSNGGKPSIHQPTSRCNYWKGVNFLLENDDIGKHLLVRRG